MEAGLEHLKRGTARHVDMMLVVAEPYFRSLEAAMRTAALADELGIQHIKVVANKVRNTDDMEAIKTFCDQHNMEIIGTVPLDDEMVEAERQEKAPYDFAPHSTGVESIRKIAQSVDDLAGG
jgi:CO dehydrogenase maturation factor